ncbi:MAG: helix-turn-helix transcriptional regulator [Bdellovibrionaceae bacterium]|nr:helix-turn-helix transcriptional regulator [Pseudobdellovibrionaceae bacterium]
MSSFDDVFKAISHRTRREILTFISNKKDKISSSEINMRFPVSWPTMCNHLKVLTNAKLLKKRKVRREVFYSLNTQRLIGVVKTWINSFE